MAMINKFTLKFLKYMTIFVLLNFTITCTLIIILFFKVLPNIYWDINEIEPTYLETYGITQEPNANLKSLAKRVTSIYTSSVKWRHSLPKIET